jgi:serine/threonine protein phosphatase PrpC
MSVRGAVAAHTVQGPRPGQEDRYVVEPLCSPEGVSGYLLAVLDGHGGAAVAEYCQRELPAVFSLAGPEDAENALRRAVRALDQGTRKERSGTTLSAVCLLESHEVATVAVLGDSPVFTLDRRGRTAVSPVHNVRVNLEERRQAEGRGGLYLSGYMVSAETGDGLQVSRALGDASLEGIVSREPQVYSVELGPGSLVVLATDGLVDLSAGEERAFAEEALKGTVDPESLIRWAERRGLRDNATAVVWRASGVAG